MKISEINIYPIKSLKGIAVGKAKIERRGLEFDRSWMLVDTSGKFLTQRDCAAMATIKLELSDSSFRISSKGLKSIDLPFRPESNSRTQVTIWKDRCDAVEMGEPFDHWFSNALKFDCRLVYLPENSERPVDRRFNLGGESVSFADAFPVLITVENSLEDLNRRLVDTILMNRFRPNLVVADAGAFAEDRWKKIRIGETLFRVVRPSARCVVTTIDQTKGIPTGKEPLSTLSGYRSAGTVFETSYESFGLDKNAVVFGENMVAENPGKTIRIGDYVKIIETRD